MRKLSRALVATGFFGILAAGTGCAAFDNWYDDGKHSTEYPREAPPAPPKEATKPADSATAPAGIYPGVEKK